MKSKSAAAEMLTVAFSFLVFLFLLSMDIGPFLRSFGGRTGLNEGRELVKPLDGFTGPARQDPRLVAGGPKKSATKQKGPDDSWTLPGEHLVVTPEDPKGSFPMVEGRDGRLYQTGPDGSR
jgi:hypothetical protein